MSRPWRFNKTTNANGSITVSMATDAQNDDEADVLMETLQEMVAVPHFEVPTIDETPKDESFVHIDRK